MPYGSAQTETSGFEVIAIAIKGGGGVKKKRVGTTNPAYHGNNPLTDIVSVLCPE
jgi:hypothetical protein